MEEKTCILIGHREAPDSLLSILDAEVERHITAYGVTDFVVGRYGRFDGIAVRCVKAAKKRHTEVTLTLLLPYHPYDRPTPTPPGFDGTFYPPGMETVPKRAAIVRANRYMVEHSDYPIAYVWHSVSNAWDFVEYGQKREMQGKNFHNHSAEIAKQDLQKISPHDMMKIGKLYQFLAKGIGRGSVLR